MRTRKLTLMAAAAAAVLAPAVMAQTSGVTIYGRLYPYLVSEDGSGATAGTTSSATIGAAPAAGVDGVVRNNGFAYGNSRLGIRGKEDLGGGLTAIFQMETVVGVTDGVGGDGSGTFWNRDTFVGLQSGMGTVKLGLMDSIFKNYGDTLGILGISSGTFMSTSNILRKPGFGTSNDARFHERLRNSIQYESPELNGFQAGLQYALVDPKAGNRHKTATSMGVKYDNGPLYVALAHEIHNDYFGGSAQAPSSMRNSNATANPNVNSKDRATQVTVEYRLNKVHKFEVDVIRKEYKETATVTGRFASYKNTAYLLAMENRWNDQWRTAANYVRSNAGSCTRVAAACTTDGLEGTKFTVAASYSLSRRTMFFASAARLTNGTAARFSTNDLANRTNPGEDLTQFALGVSHSF